MKNSSPTLKRTNLPQSRVRLVIPVTNAHFRPAFERELKDVAAEVRLEGFRPGKAPVAQVLAQVGRPRIEAGALDRAINTAYVEVMKSEEITPVAAPEVTLDSYTAPAEDADDATVVATVTAEVDILPEVQVKGYEKLRVKSPKIEPVKDAELQEVIDYLRKQQMKLQDISEGATLAKGMWADIGFAGTVDGVAREDMKSEHYPLVIGEGNLIPGFEEELIGLKSGAEKTFTISFPKDYHSEALAGKAAEFTVTVHEVKDVVLPVVDAEFAKKFGHDTVEAMEKSIRETLGQEREQEHKTKVEELVLDELLKIAKFEVPAALVAQEEERLRGETLRRLEAAHIGHDHEVALDERLAGEVKEQAVKNVRIGLTLGKVIELEGITTSDEQAMRKVVDRLIEIATK